MITGCTSHKGGRRKGREEGEEEKGEEEKYLAYISNIILHSIRKPKLFFLEPHRPSLLLLLLVWDPYPDAQTTT